MSALLSNFFGQLEGTHPRQAKTAATNPDLAQARADVDRLTEATEKMIDWFAEFRTKSAQAVADQAPGILEQYFADRGVKARMVGSGEKRADKKTACQAVFGKDFPACNVMDEIFGGGNG